VIPEEKEESQPDTLGFVFRIIFVLLILGGIVGWLAYEKMGQFEAMGAQFSQLPPPITVTVEKAESQIWQRRIKAIGTLVARQSIDITAEVPGLIQKFHFNSGSDVRKGQLLLEIEDSVERAALASAQANYDADNSQYQRLIKLKDKSFVTDNDLENQASKVNIARAQLVVAETALAKKQIVAPFSGKLGIRQADVGEYIAPGTAIISLQSISRLFLDFTLPERYFRELKIGQTVQFEVNSFPDQVFEARVETWNPALDKDTRNISVRATVKNEKRRLAPGMFADMQITSTEKIEVVTVPEPSVFYNIYGEAAYVLENSGSADLPDYQLAARQIEVIYRHNSLAGVVSGLQPGDQVVTSGQLKLYPGLKVAIFNENVKSISSTLENVITEDYENNLKNDELKDDEST
jgi:membrane fusion protein (multidrug efflux system)